MAAAPLSRRSCMVFMLAPDFAAIINTVFPNCTKEVVKAS
jgi:hypothetical protein